MTKKVIVITKDGKPTKVYATAPDAVVEFIETGVLTPEAKCKVNAQLEEIKEMEKMNQIFEL